MAEFRTEWYQNKTKQNRTESHFDIKGYFSRVSYSIKETDSMVLKVMSLKKLNCFPKNLCDESPLCHLPSLFFPLLHMSHSLDGMCVCAVIVRGYMKRGE